MDIIQEYSFGRIRIGDRTYTSDVIVYPDRVEEWRREEGHLVHPRDLGGVLDAGVNALVIGTGHSGMLKIAPDTEHACSEHGIDLIKGSTAAAVRAYNEMVDAGGMRVAAALHLTC